MPDTSEPPTRRRLPQVMTIKEAEAIAGALGHPSKMPGFSYGISATKCHTGSKLRKVPGSVCSSCYALTDWYRSWKPLLHGHERRWQGIHHPRWVDAMTRLIHGACVPPDRNWFRWHDSGDLQGVWHLKKIAEVCSRTPVVHHWLPTREYEYVAKFVATGNTIPVNLTIRLSAHMIDAEPVIPDDLAPMIGSLPVSTVSTASMYHPGMSGTPIVEGKGSIECRAVESRDNKCGSCRACWLRNVRSVNYPQH